MKDCDPLSMHTPLAAAIVAAQHGASRVVVNDICTWALSSAQLNIALNADALLCARDDPSATSFVLEPADIIGRQFPLHITPHTRDPAAPDTDHARGTDGSNGAADVPIDVVLAGDVMYEQPLATHVVQPSLSHSQRHTTSSTPTTGPDAETHSSARVTRRSAEHSSANEAKRASRPPV